MFYTRLEYLPSPLCDEGEGTASKQSHYMTLKLLHFEGCVLDVSLEMKSTVMLVITRELFTFSIPGTVLPAILKMHFQYLFHCCNVVYSTRDHQRATYSSNLCNFHIFVLWSWHADSVLVLVRHTYGPNPSVNRHRGDRY